VQRAHCYEGSRGPGQRARESSTAAAAAAAVAVAVAEVGCNGLEREWKGLPLAEARWGAIGWIPINILLPVKLPHFITLLRRYRRP